MRRVHTGVDKRNVGGRTASGGKGWCLLPSVARGDGIRRGGGSGRQILHRHDRRDTRNLPEPGDARGGNPHRKPIDERAVPLGDEPAHALHRCLDGELVGLNACECGGAVGLWGIGDGVAIKNDDRRLGVARRHYLRCPLPVNPVVPRRCREERSLGITSRACPGLGHEHRGRDDGSGHRQRDAQPPRQMAATSRCGAHAAIPPGGAVAMASSPT